VNHFTNGRPKTGAPILMVCMSYDVFLSRELPFGAITKILMQVQYHD